MSTALVTRPIALPPWGRQVLEGVPELLGQEMLPANGLSVRYSVLYISRSKGARCASAYDG